MKDLIKYGKLISAQVKIAYNNFKECIIDYLEENNKLTKDNVVEACNKFVSFKPSVFLEDMVIKVDITTDNYKPGNVSGITVYFHSFLSKYVDVHINKQDGSITTIKAVNIHEINA